MSLILAAVQAAKPAVEQAVANVPMIIEHHVQGVWPVVWAWVIGAFMGIGTTYWLSKVGFSGAVAEVKSEISTLRLDVANLKEKLTPVTPVVVTNVPVA